MRSLRNRLLFAASLTLALFLVLVAAALNQAFESSAKQGQFERMQALTYTLLGSLEPSEYGILTISAKQLPDARLERPQSGLEAALYSDGSALLWGSPSLGDSTSGPAAQPAGEWRFEEGQKKFTLLFGLRYSIDGAAARSYTLQVSEDAASYRLRIRNYRRTLWGALTIGAIVLLLLQGAVLRWSLRPLKELVGELRAVEQGSSESIDGDYPEELQPLTEGLNAMISAERTRQTRYRNALGDLAHSLKTPLAVIGGIAERPLAGESGGMLQEQLNRMRLIVDHQLKRAALMGARALAEPIALRPLLEKVAAALSKVYARQHLQVHLEVPAELMLRADAGDLFELMGNLMDNAAKHGHKNVWVTARRNSPMQVCVTVADDGVGFPADAANLLERGARADTRVEGQGLGLAAARDIVEAYGGSLVLGKRVEGGGQVQLTFKA